MPVSVDGASTSGQTTVLDEAITVPGSDAVLNFTGAGVTATQDISNPSQVNVVIPGGGGGGGGGLADVHDDTTPQLGGDLDVDGQSIISAPGSNADVVVAPDGTGQVKVNSTTTDCVSVETTGTTALMQFKGNASTSTGCRIGASQDDLLIQNAGLGSMTFSLYNKDALVISRDVYQRNLISAGNITLNNDGDGEPGDVRFIDSGAAGSGTGNDNYVGFQAPAAIAADHVYTWPGAFPGSDMVLQSDSSGTLSWVAGGGGGGGASLTPEVQNQGSATLTGADKLILVDPSVNTSPTFTLPLAATAGAGARFIIKDTSGALSSLNTITLQGNSGELIDGGTIQPLTNAYSSVEVLSDGTSAWWIR